MFNKKGAYMIDSNLLNLSKSIKSTNVMTYQPVYIPGGYQTQFYIFEKRINVSTDGNVELIVCGFPDNITFPVILLLNVNGLVYDCWIDYFRHEGCGMHAIEALVLQDTLYFHFIRDNHEGAGHSVISLRNVYKDIFLDIVKYLKKYKAWDVFDFIGRKNEIINNYSNKSVFWETMKEVMIQNQKVIR